MSDKTTYHPGHAVNRRFELTGADWDPRATPTSQPPREGRWKDHRTIISGVLFGERTGTTWRDLPKCFDNWKTVYQRKRRWAIDGTWDPIAEALRLDADEGPEWTVGVDTTILRVHQHAAGARRTAAADHQNRAGGPNWLRRPRDPRTITGRPDHEDPPGRRHPTPLTHPPHHPPANATTAADPLRSWNESASRAASGDP
jgi:transposase